MRREYVFYIGLALALAALSFFAQLPTGLPAGQATDPIGWTVSITQPPSPVHQNQPTLSITGSIGTVAQTPDCSPGCGQPCWLTTSTSGASPGTHTNAEGKVGILDCSGLCWDVREYVDNCK